MATRDAGRAGGVRRRTGERGAAAIGVIFAFCHDLAPSAGHAERRGRIITAAVESVSIRAGPARRVNEGALRGLALTHKETAMKVMVIVKATKNSEAGVMPTEPLFEAMGAYNEELVKAGIMLAGDGLQPSVNGKRIQFAGGKRTVVDGPFAETKELIAGFWIWQVRSMEEAVEWARRCPDPMPGEDAELEIRPLYEAADFGEEYTPELQARDAKLREEIERQQKA
jgi:hypothetical protein